MSDETNTDFPSSADRAVDSLHRIDEKVNRLREDRLNDPDSPVSYTHLTLPTT